MNKLSGDPEKDIIDSKECKREQNLKKTEEEEEKNNH